jgi:hypothetical protein
MVMSCRSSLVAGGYHHQRLTINGGSPNVEAYPGSPFAGFGRENSYGQMKALGLRKN